MILENTPREIMNARQAAAYLGVSKDTLYKHVNESGGVPAFKIGNRWRFKKALLDRWINDQIVQRSGPLYETAEVISCSKM